MTSTDVRNRLKGVFGFPVTPFRKDLKAGKTFEKNLALNIDLFNVLNHNNLSNVIGKISSPNFGKGTISLLPRTAQLSVKYNF